MSTNKLITAQRQAKNKMILGFVKQVEALENEVASLAEELADAQAQLTRFTSQTPSPDTPADHFLTLIQSASTGDKIGAIKAVRNITGLGLKEAKDLVESAGLQAIRAA